MAPSEIRHVDDEHPAGPVGKPRRAAGGRENHQAQTHVPPHRQQARQQQHADGRKCQRPPRKDREEREQQRTDRDARRKGQPEQESRKRRHLLPEFREPHRELERDRRDRGEEQCSEQRGWLRRPAQADHDGKAERDDLREAEGEQAKWWKARIGGTGAINPEGDGVESAMPHDLETERKCAAKVDADALPVGSSFDGLPVGANDAVAGLQPGARRDRVGRDAPHDHRAAPEVGTESERRHSVQVAGDQKREVACVRYRDRRDRPAQGRRRTVGRVCRRRYAIGHRGSARTLPLSQPETTRSSFATGAGRRNSPVGRHSRWRVVSQAGAALNQ